MDNRLKVKNLTTEQQKAMVNGRTQSFLFRVFSGFCESVQHLIEWFVESPQNIIRSEVTNVEKTAVEIGARIIKAGRDIACEIIREILAKACTISRALSREISLTLKQPGLK
ncbi:hypothetical protein Trydic_g1493 [Trypoxylus dichotomus]